MQAVNYSDFRTNMKSYLDKAEKEDDIVVITRKKGVGNGVYMPLDVFNRMQSELSSYKETIYLLSSSANKENLLQSIEEHKKSKLKKISMKELNEMSFD
jgi:antitoxin YefM